MLNQVILVGRVKKEIVIKKLDNDKQVATIELIVQRPFKNEDGVYEADYIECTLYNMVAENTAEYCHKGDIVCIRGRIQTFLDKPMVVAEKVTLLSSKKEEE